MQHNRTPDFYYSTDIVVRGPWLIDSNQLSDLDKTIDDVWQQLSAYREERIQHEVQTRLKQRLHPHRETAEPTRKEALSLEAEILDDVRQNYTNSTFSRDLTLFLNGNKKLKVNSFKDASTHVAVADVEAFGFTVELRSRDVTIRMLFDGNDRKLTLHAYPEELPITRDVFGSLKNWIDNNQPSKWQRNWLPLSAMLWTLWLFGFVFGSSIYFSFISSAPPTGETEAREILRQGVSATNQFKAIQTMLTLQLRPPAGSQPIHIATWWLPACVVGFCVCLALSPQPAGHISIGKGAAKVKRWRMWIRFITIAIPGFVLSAFILPTLVSWLKHVFN
jgi:hypothetical protein